MHSHMFIVLIDIALQGFIWTFLQKTDKNIWIFLALNIWRIAVVRASFQDILSTLNSPTNGKFILNQRQIILSDE